MAGGRTVPVISHRLSTLRRADHIFVLDGAQITEQGPHDEFVAPDREYARSFDLQAERFR